METSLTKPHWTICRTCHGQARVVRAPSTKRRRLFADQMNAYVAGGSIGPAPQPPASNTDICTVCNGSGLAATNTIVLPDPQKYPHVAIVGGGIGGTALAVACLHRGIPLTLYERDSSFDARSQGYGLTLQQASNAIKGFGIIDVPGGITSTRHVVFNSDGKIIGEWGLRKWKGVLMEQTAKRKNVHVARQTLRSLLLQELRTSGSVQWGHQLTNMSHNDDGTVRLDFVVDGKQTTSTADLVVGADGIRSRVRQLVIGESTTPMRYLDCMVILGICRLDLLNDPTNPLFDSATVFQMVNGHDRIYVMPYDADTIMWQVSFPISESDARNLHTDGPAALKSEAIKRMGHWHSPIPEILSATPESLITGYPAYDRELFDPAWMRDAGNVTLMGDAAHPMSPFKGQGANQALLDALALARKISLECDSNPDWRQTGIRKCVLNDFESEMAQRSATKVIGSAQAAQLLHSDAVLYEGDEPRGRGLK